VNPAHPTTIMIFFGNPMPGTSNAMIIINYHTYFNWEIRYGFICRKSRVVYSLWKVSHEELDST
jgi:hypothetical protein